MPGISYGFSTSPHSPSDRPLGRSRCALDLTAAELGAQRVIDGPSCSRPDRNGGSGDGNHADDAPVGGGNDPELSSESAVSTLTSYDQPFMQQLDAHLYKNQNYIADLQKKLVASKERAKAQ